MKQLKFVFFLLFFPFSLFGFSQQNPDSINVQEDKSTQINIDLPSTLQIRNVENEINKTSFVEKNMPWFVALIIGLLSAFVNFWMAHRLRQSNERSLKSQVESSERNLEKQIESNERNVQKQIETSRETQLIEIKGTLATNNRQAWINELRQTLAEYLSITGMLMPLSSKPTVEDLKERSAHILKMSLSKAKLELLMNDSKPEQKELLDEIENMLRVIINKPDSFLDESRTSRTKIIYAARKLFDIHWEKIKDLK